MRETKWLDNNEHTLYPFSVSGDVVIVQGDPNPELGVPRALVADAGFVLGPRALAAPDAPLWLQRISRYDAEIINGDPWPGRYLLDFCWSPDGVTPGAYKFEFVVPLDTPAGTTLFANAIPEAGDYGQFGVSSDTEDPDWGTAFIVVGHLGSAVMPANGPGYIQTDRARSAILPACVQSLSGSKVFAIHIANDPGPQFVACDGTPPAFPGTSECPWAVNMDTWVRGDVKIEAGYNAKVAAVVSSNQITLSSSLGAGAGLPCVQVSRFPDGRLPDGPQACTDLIYTINGVSPDENNHFTLEAGRGFHVARGGEHQLLVLPDSAASLFCTTDWGQT